MQHLAAFFVCVIVIPYAILYLVARVVNAIEGINR